MKILKIIGSVLILGALAACSKQQSGTQPVASSDKAGNGRMPDIQKAIAVIHPLKGSKISGTVTFSKEANGIKVEAHINGLTPGNHGFHVHQWGDCSSDDGTSAGPHFNPNNQKHGAPEDSIRHVGDLGNILADDNGVGYYERVDTVISFTGRHSIIGRAIIIHEKADDMESQPSGDAGARIGCGVIGIANHTKND